MKKEILRLQPVFKQMIWGGERLGSEWHYAVPGEHTGECWGICAHEHGDSIVTEGTYRGKALSQLWQEEPELFGNVDSDRFPLLIKIIDAKADLSIQVHPNDAYAKVHENGSLGKTECWYILDAPEDGSLVIGHNAQTKDELEDMIKNGRWNDFIQEVPVKKGDFIQIEPGTVHAIKSGILLLETQQNSDITYRVYDYDRLSNGKPRELHVEKSLDVITVPARPLSDCIVSVGEIVKNQLHLLMDCNCYKVWKLEVDRICQFNQIWPFLNMSIISGEGKINGFSVKKGDHFIIPNGFGDVVIEGTLEAIVSTV